MRKIEAVIFDMDGVLVNSEHFYVEMDKKIFGKMGLVMSEEEYIGYMGKASDVMWKEIKQNWELPYSVDELETMSNEEAKSFFMELPAIEPIPGVMDVVGWLAAEGLPLAVASSAGPEIIEIVIDRLGLRTYFRHVVNSKIVGKSKPEPDIFLHTATLLGVSPDKCLVVEDSTNGIKAAKRAGMYCVAYQGVSYFGQDQSEADVCIEDYSQFRDVIERLI